MPQSVFLGGGSDQSLNTTDSPTFAGLSISDAPVLRKITMSPPTGVTAEAFDGGELAAGTYHFKVVALAPGQGADGDATLPSSEVSATVTAPNDGVGSISLGWDDTTWAIGYRVYIGTGGAGSEDRYISTSSSDAFITTLVGATEEAPPVANEAIFYAMSFAGEVWVFAGDAIPAQDNISNLGRADERWRRAFIGTKLVVGLEGAESLEMTSAQAVFRAALAEAGSPVNPAPSLVFIGSYWDGASAQDIDTFWRLDVTDHDPLTYRTYLRDGTLGSDLLSFDQRGVLTLDKGVVTLTPRAFADLPASASEGMMAWVNDSNTATWGATIAGGGANKVLAVFNSVNWTVCGK